MKQEIMNALIAKFPGVSATILGRIADKLAKTATSAEDVKTAVDGIAKETIARGAVMGRPSFGNGGKNAPTGAGAAKEATTEDVAEDDRRIMAGEEPMPSEESGNYVPDVPEKFGKWIDKNTERIERAKSLPYFMRDNEKYIKPLTITPQARAGADEAQKFNEEMMRAADAPKVPKVRTREEILAAAQERHAARTQEQIDAIRKAWNDRKTKLLIPEELRAKSAYLKGEDYTFDKDFFGLIDPNRPIKLEIDDSDKTKSYSSYIGDLVHIGEKTRYERSA